jgi:Sulfotransferase family
MPIQRPPAPFVVGVPRSGTTLLRLMLDAHPQLAVPAETHFFPDLIERWHELTAAGAADDRIRAEVIDLITNHPRWPELGVSEAAVAARLDEGDALGLPQALRSVGAAYALAAGKPRWGDKTPGYVMAMVPIHRALPEARFVHVIRDGRDVAVSLAGVGWGPGDAAGAAKLWSRRIRIARKQAADLPPGTYTEVRYEDLVTDPHAVLEELCRFLELPFSEEMLSYSEGGSRMLDAIGDLGDPSGGVKPAAERRRQHASAARPPSTDRIGRWRHDLSEDERRRFESIAGETLEELGYEVGA